MPGKSCRKYYENRGILVQSKFTKLFENFLWGLDSAKDCKVFFENEKAWEIIKKEEFGTSNLFLFQNITKHECPRAKRGSFTAQRLDDLTVIKPQELVAVALVFDSTPLDATISRRLTWGDQKNENCMENRKLSHLQSNSGAQKLAFFMKIQHLQFSLARFVLAKKWTAN